MLNLLFSVQPVCQQQALGAVRIITGAFMVYHGVEVFFPDTMMQYLDWEPFKSNPNGKLMVYVGKGAEFVSGLMLLTGLFTRIGCLVLAAAMLYVSFVVGNGKIWYDAQHPFMFVLMAVLFFFTGPGSWSMDAWISKFRRQ